MHKGIGVLDKEEEEIGGIIRIRRTKGVEEEGKKPRRNKTPRTKREKDVLSEGQDTPAVILPVVTTTVEEKNEKKEEGEKEMNNVNGTPASVIRPRFELCLGCGKNSKLADVVKDGKNIHYLVCKACNDRYTDYAQKIAGEIAKGKNPTALNKIDWLVEKLDRELDAARQLRANAPTRVAEKVLEKSKGKTLPREVFAALQASIKEEVTQDDYNLVRRLNARLQAAKKLKEELEQKLATPTLPKPYTGS